MNIQLKISLHGINLKSAFVSTKYFGSICCTPFYHFKVAIFVDITAVRTNFDVCLHGYEEGVTNPMGHKWDIRHKGSRCSPSGTTICQQDHVC